MEHMVSEVVFGDWSKFLLIEPLVERSDLPVRAFIRPPVGLVIKHPAPQSFLTHLYLERFERLDEGPKFFFTKSLQLSRLSYSVSGVHRDLLEPIIAYPHSGPDMSEEREHSVLTACWRVKQAAVLNNV